MAHPPRCGGAAPLLPEALARLGSSFLVAGLGIAALLSIMYAGGSLTIAAGVVTVSGTAIAGAAFAGTVAAVATYFTLLFTIIGYAMDRCNFYEGWSACAAGVVTGVVEPFRSAVDHAFPFSAMHDRLDVVAKSRFWDLIEGGGAFVHCTDEPPPRLSEIVRCYFFNAQVCGAASGSTVGAATAGILGVIAGVAAAAAIGCATVILCLLALIVAIVLVAVILLAGALIGGQFGRIATTNPLAPAGGGVVLRVGHLITVSGNMRQRDYDQGANVFYWCTSMGAPGESHSPRPFSHLDIDAEFPSDGC